MSHDELQTKFVWASVLVLGTLLSAMSLSGCKRSDAFRKDQAYYSGEPLSYYARNSKLSATQKLDPLGQPKKRIVIFDFWNDTPVKQEDMGVFAAEELKRGLYTSQRVIIPEDIKLKLTTADFVQGERVRVAQLIREGKRLGVNVLVIGRVTRVVFRQRGEEVGLFRQKQSVAAVDVEMKVFDVAAGREISAIGKSGDAASHSVVAFEQRNLESPEFRAELIRLAIRNTVNQLVPEVIRSIEKMTWQGHIAKVIGTQIYVNAGRTSGLVAGDILKVLTQGDEVFDPATGAFLGKTQGQLKGTIEVKDFIGEDGAVGQIHTGGNFQEGDSVQLY